MNPRPPGCSTEGVAPLHTAPLVPVHCATSAGNCATSAGNCATSAGTAPPVYIYNCIFNRGLSHPNPESLNSNKKGVKLPFLSAEGCHHTSLEGQHCPLITYHGVFSRVEKPSDYITSRLFLINKKGRVKSFLPCYSQSPVMGIYSF